MTRAVGVFCIFAACAGMAASVLAERRRRLRCLDELTAALLCLRAELMTSVRPTAELCRILSQSARGETAAFFALLLKSLDRLGDRPFSALWREAAESALRPLHTEEREKVVRLGASLGRYELQEQLRAIDGCAGALRAALDRARAEAPAQRRLTLGLALSAGALLTILLL